VPAGQRGRAAAGVLSWSYYLMSYGAPVFEGGALDAHQPAEERHAAQESLPAFGRSRVPELDVVPLTTRKCLPGTWFASLCRRPESSWFGRRCGFGTRAASFTFRRRCARPTNSRPGPGSSAARLDSEPPRGAEAAHPEGDGALAACVAAGHAGAASRSPWLLLTAVVTLGCLRISEVARLQVCCSSTT
jgi:hypothetical protein